MSNTLNLKFLGAAHTVTGSCTLLTYRGRSILIDCGLFQGPKDIRNLNRRSMKDFSNVQAVILTHAHVDHSGLLPKLAKDGFRGPIYSSRGTFDLCQILLPDAAHLQEEDARYANESGYSHHKPALPLYNGEDAHEALKLFKVLSLGEWKELFPGLSCRLLHSGHILGSTFVQISFDTENGPKILTFSGDIGNDRSHILRPPVNIHETDFLVMESTYGDRIHPINNVLAKLEEVIHYIEKSKGVLVIPAFSVGRTQELLFLIRELESQKKISRLPLYVDSPMAQDATQIYLKHPEQLKLIEKEGSIRTTLSTAHFHAIASVKESMELNLKEGPMIIISAAGMLTGGRILHHIKQRLPHSRNAILFVGFQAEGTKGRLLQNGLSSIRIHHEEVPVNARIFSLEGLSAHADSNEMVEWMKQLRRPPLLTILNHGEKFSLEALGYRIRHELKVDVKIPLLNEEINLK